MSTSVFILDENARLIEESIIFRQDYFLFEMVTPLYDLLSQPNFFSPKSASVLDFETKSIISFINQTEDIGLYNNLESITSLYHYSIPNTKLSYPEPFIAAPSFMHSDLWFVHILVYQYWLWFVFVFIIVFFFITFICTIRWCNMRTRPRRETRGVSRSKCGDLITACVPVTWAASIIVNESTDAIDYYDGFGTTELVVGIRAYQWGWEYYYPKDIDLNYNIKNNYSAFIGNSLKYSKTSEINLKANNLWKFYQNKTSDQVITPAHILALPMDNYKLFNFLNFNDVGSNSTQESNAFKRVRSFSKTYTSNLVFVPNNYSSKYKNISYLYVNDGAFADSSLYGLKRQHNTLSSSSMLNNQATFLGLNSFNKIINFNFKNNLDFLHKSAQTRTLSFLQKSNTSQLNESSSKIQNIFNKMRNSPNLTPLNNSSIFNKTPTVINDNSDKKKIKYPIFKLFNLKLKKNKLINSINLNKINNYNDLSLLDSNDELRNRFFNYDLTYKSINTFSSNQAVSLSNRYIRNFIQNKPNVSNYNLSFQPNPIINYTSVVNKNFGFDNLFFYNTSKNYWIDTATTSKLASIKTQFDYPYSPITSNHPAMKTLDYDNLKNSLIEDAPSVLQGKEEIMPNFLTTIYWNFYWANSSFDWKIYNNHNYHSIHKSFYLPTFSFYYDYDFRNWQSIELLEDSFWESVYSVYTHDEYTVIADDFYDYEFFKKFNNFFNSTDRVTNFKDHVSTKPFFIDTNSLGEYYANSIYLDDYVTPTNLLPTKDFFIFPIFSALNHAEDSYESNKFVNHLFNINNKLFLNAAINGFHPYSYFFVFDAFRSDSEDFSWFLDENNFLKQWSNFFSYNNVPYWNCLFENSFIELLKSDAPFATPYWATDSNFDFLYFETSTNANKSTRFNNHVNLRGPVKNSIVTYNAIQKVFRTRFDENRSNTKLIDFSHSYTKQPFVSSTRIQYEKILGKTKENFFKVNFYKNSLRPFINNLYSTNTGLNFYFYDFPFLMALKSDASRYLWFDWFAKWGFYEVQPSSSSRYAIYGMPYFSKNFEFTTMDSEALNESETYLIRLAHARRDYLPNWAYTPYFYARNLSWYKTQLMYEILEQSENQLTASLNLLENMKWYWNKTVFYQQSPIQFFPSHSGINSYARLGWKPKNSIQSYYYSVSTLIDILTKREYLYRELLSYNKKIIQLPIYLTNSPANPIINELKSSFLFVDPISYNNEYSREIYYSSLEFFNFTILKSFLTSCNDFINLNLITEYLFFYFFNSNLTSNLQTNSELYKSQYRPLRKGITNMIRLHATGAVAMPIEIRLQILASSKDVIHSWAIPSAGIKIDCVPGYSSHRVMIFLVSGIFWGQCMEICGRYHHWMPIIIYFMKRDLFFLWCTHFVFLTGANNMWNINDKQFVDYIRLASFDKYSWLSELNN